jgi:hypothetical protein
VADRETARLRQEAGRRANWRRWGPYLAERQWGTVREDYSADGAVWDAFPHDHARSRAYRWGEDGILGLCDREGRLCFAHLISNFADDGIDAALALILELDRKIAGVRLGHRKHAKLQAGATRCALNFRSVSKDAFDVRQNPIGFLE